MANGSIVRHHDTLDKTLCRQHRPVSTTYPPSPVIPIHGHANIMQHHRLCIYQTAAHQRLDTWLIEAFNHQYTRAFIKSCFNQGRVRCNGTCAKAHKQPIYANIIDCYLPPYTSSNSDQSTATTADRPPQQVPYLIWKDTIIWEDDDLFVLNKPAGLLVHPGIEGSTSTLMHLLQAHHPTCRLLTRAGLVHRLDQYTSGLIIAAKTRKAYKRLINLIKNRSIKRQYIAYVIGDHWPMRAGTIDAPIGRHPHIPHRMHVSTQGKPAITHYCVLKCFRHLSYVRLLLDTGRTHQIRVHMAHVNKPIVGDTLYPIRKKPLPYHAWSDQLNHYLTHEWHNKRHALHAEHLAFTHPITQQQLSIYAPPPEDFKILHQLLHSQAVD